MAIPNYLTEVAAARDKYPEAWRHAHTGNAQTEDFIRLLAADLHKLDARCGLNGKRGNPQDISDDIIAIRGEGSAIDVITGGPMEIIDVIVGAGGPNPQPGWSVAPGGPGDRGTWVAPGPVTPGPNPPQPIPPTPPTCQFQPTNLTAVSEKLDSVLTRLETANRQLAHHTGQLQMLIDTTLQILAHLPPNLTGDLVETKVGIKDVRQALREGLAVELAGGVQVRALGYAPGTFTGKASV